jgi:type I restriction enzyme M protein
LSLTRPPENAELAWAIRKLRIVEALSSQRIELAASKFALLLDEYSLEGLDWTTAFDSLVDCYVDRSGLAGGQSHTPRPLRDLTVRLLSPSAGSTVYDPVCGTGELLLGALAAAGSAGQAGASTKVCGQEINAFSAAIAKLRFVVNGLPPENIAVGDTLLDPLFLDDGRLRKYDFVVADLPIGAHLNQESMVRLGSDPYGRMWFGPPGERAESAFL